MKDKKEVMKDVGKVRKSKIVIQKQVITQDHIGNSIKSWVDYQALWVEVNSLYGNEYYAAKSVNEENTLKFTARYAAFVDTIDTINYRVIYKNKWHDIKIIDFLNDNGIWVIIKALERGGSSV